MGNKFKKIIGLIFCIILIGVPFMSFGKELPKFQILTEDWFPYQYEKNGKLEGVAADLLVLMLARVNSSQGRNDIKMYPWARAYLLLQSQENTILFSTTRTPEREKLFKWVGPIFQNTTYLIAKRSKRITINSKDDLKKYRIGTIIDDASELFLIRLGLKLDPLHRNINSLNNVQKMEIDRIDFIVSGLDAFESDAIKLGIDPNLYETVYTVDVSDVSYAFHSNTPDWIINEFQSALDKIKAEKQLDAIMKKYGVKSSN